MRKLLWETAEEINRDVARRLKSLRKRKRMTQEDLSHKTGVSYGSIKRFERSGNISFLSMTKIAMELDCAEEIKDLFTQVAYGSIEEVYNEAYALRRVK